MSKLVTRRSLYDLIWSKSSHSINDQFGISTYILLKICGQNKIPVPSNDWWSERTLESMHKKPDLPTDEYLKDDTNIEICSYRELRQKRINEIKEDIEASCADYLTVPKRLFDPDRLVIEASDYLKGKESSYLSSEDGYICLGGDKLSISVTRRNFRRSLRILDAFIKLIRARGHEIEYSDSTISICIGKESYEFGIREKQMRIKRNERRYGSDYIPTGQLVLFIGPTYRRYEITDNQTLIEEKLSRALAHLEYTFEEQERSRRINEVAKIRRDEKESFLKAIVAKDKEEEYKYNELIKYANNWNQATIIRGFLKAFEEKTEERGNASIKIMEWIEWGIRIADWHDPLTKVDSFNFDDHLSQDLL